MYELIAIGTSWGGLAALGRLLPGIPADVHAPIVVAQHRAPGDGRDELAALLRHGSHRPVRPVEDKDPIEPDAVYLAPSDYHLLVEPGRFALSTEARVHHSRPSIDVLFESAADAYGAGVIGVILTGANQDGAAGLARIRERGGIAIVQDPETAERREMPDAALAAAGGTVLALDEIGAHIAGLCLAGSMS